MQSQLDPAITAKIEDISKLSKDEILAIWQRSDEFARVYKDTEQSLRKLVVERFGDASIESGTQTIELGNDYKLKIRKTLNYNLKDGEELDKLRAEVPSDVDAKLFSTKTSLVKGEYEKLSDEQKHYFAPVVTIGVGMPQVEIVEPRTKE